MKGLVFSLLMLGIPAYAASNEAANDEAIERAAETLIQEGAKLEDVAAAKAESANAPAGAKDARTEEETPVVLSEPSAPKAGGSVVWRLLVSVLVIAAAGLGLAYASRRWTRRPNVGGTETRIEMMHQFHMGPRKSLALVRVAGETLLLGVTDQNINMLKAVTIIDQDMEAALNQDFNAFLDDEFSVADVNAVVGRRA